jgi:hypothetical protein
MPRVFYNGEKFHNSQPETLKAVGLIVSEVIPVVHASSANNELHALHNRVAHVPLSPDLDFFATYKEYTMMNFDALFPDHHRYDIKYDFDTWNARFPPPRRVAHLRAYEVDPYYPALVDKAVRTKAFVKLEKRLDANPLTYEEGKPRFIMGGNDEYNVIVGPWCFALGQKLSVVWNAGFAVYYSGGSNSEDVGDWFSQVGHNHPYYRYFDADFKSFDSTQYMELLRFELELDGKLGLPDHVIRLMQLACSHRGATPHGVIYFLYDGRASGGPNTMSGNSIVNGTTKVFSIQCSNPTMSITAILSHIKLAVIGDDGVDVVDRKLQVDYDQHLTRLGLNSVITARPDSRFLEYCSARFWPTSDGFVLGRKLGLAIPKLGYYINQSSRKLLGIHKSALIGEYLNAYYIPPYFSIVSSQLLLLKGVRARPAPKAGESRNIRATRKHSPSADTWQFLDAVYDWSHSDQQRLDSVLASITTLPSLLPGHLVEKFLIKDSDLTSWKSGCASLGVFIQQTLGDCDNITKDVMEQFKILNSRAKQYPALRGSENPYLEMLNTCFVAPVVEEYIKRVRYKGVPVGCFILTVSELFLSMIAGLRLEGDVRASYISSRFLAFLMHWVWYYLPMKWAILGHVLWNMVSLGTPEPLIGNTTAT